jgi:hypothetical protein
VYIAFKITKRFKSKELIFIVLFWTGVLHLCD